MRKRMGKLLSILLTLVMVVGLVPATALAAENYFAKLEATDASVTLDGTNPGTVTVSLVGNADMNVYAIQGEWDTEETEGTGKLDLSEITTDISNMKFTGMNYADAPTGKVLWSDDTFDAPAVVADGTKFLNATYTVAADTPSGTYTVRYKNVCLTATDYNSYTDTIYWTAKITVTNNAPVHEHTGGTATCKTLAVCGSCGESYGSVNASNHEGAAKWTTTATTHAKAYDCCGAEVVAEENHEYDNACDTTCNECGYERTVAGHTGGEATCKTLAVCSSCGESYGSVNASNHEGTAEWTTTATTHAKAYDCCGAEVVAEENHEYDNACDTTCNECGYERTVAGHTGGEATCKTPAVCESCGESYGSVDATNHEGTAEYVDNEDGTHDQVYDCCEAVAVDDEAHDFADGDCVCGAKAPEAPKHEHNWATEDWEKDETHHWHECYANTECDITDNSKKDGYGEHEYVDGVCVCGAEEKDVPVEEKYTVTVENGSGDGEYAAGAEVTIKADSKSGYKFDKWIVESDVEVEIDVNDSETTFTMPAGDVKVTADYDKKSSGSSGGGSSTKYTVTLEDTDNGSVESSRTKASKGTTVTITVDPEEGYEVDDIVVETKAGKEVEVTDKGEGVFTFKMPAANVTVSVDFAKADVEDSDAKDEVEYIQLTIDSVIAWVFDEYVANDVAPVIRNARTMLPARFVAEALGGVVTWNEEAQKVTIVNGEDTIEIFIGEPFATVNGNPVELDSPAFIENSRTYLPIRFIAENMGATVTWDADARTVTIVPGK